MADTPEAFDVIVMPNLYGDVLSDVAAQITGSVGLAGSANIGDHCSMFEAIHGSAPRRAGQNMANPSGLLHGAILMLVHIGQGKVAERVHNAWLKTIEDGIHTYDIYEEGVSQAESRHEGIRRRRDRASGPKTAESRGRRIRRRHRRWTLPLALPAAAPKKERVGVDVFIDKPNGNPDEIAAQLQQHAS